MIPGQTVFYRITYGQAEKVNKRRKDAEKFRELLSLLPDRQEILRDFLSSGFVVHYGSPVKGGELLPAVVVRAYSALEREHIDPSSNGPSGWARKAFSGVADIRVILPGNDDLWVPGAQLDMSPISSTSKGQGVTAIPEFGKFVSSAPATLI
jgi:hypothetical protein